MQGFYSLIIYKKKWEFSEFEKKTKFKAKVSEGVLNNEKILFLKPLTYMNLSGTSIKKVLDFYKIDIDDFLVIFDDKDMKFSSVRFRKKGSSGGHRGVGNIIDCLGTSDFARIKIGIDSESRKGSTCDFVLAKFNKEEIEMLEKEIFPVVEERLKEWI